MECTQLLDDFSFEESPKVKKEKRKVATLEIPGGISYPIYTGENRIGRDASTCSVLITSMALSKEHAVIQVTDSDNHLVYDLCSRNRTRLGKLVLEPNVRYQLLDKSKLILADVSAVYHKLQDDPEAGAMLKLSATSAEDTDFIPETPVQSHRNLSSKIARVIESPGETSIVECSQPPKEIQNRVQIIKSQTEVMCKEEEEDDIDCKSDISFTKSLFQDSQNVSTSEDVLNVLYTNEPVTDASESIYEAETQCDIDFGSSNIFEAQTQDVLARHIPSKVKSSIVSPSNTEHSSMLNKVTEEDSNANPYLDKSMSENVLNTLVEETCRHGEDDKMSDGNKKSDMSSDVQSRSEQSSKNNAGQSVDVASNKNLVHTTVVLSLDSEDTVPLEICNTAETGKSENCSEPDNSTKLQVSTQLVAPQQNDTSIKSDQSVQKQDDKLDHHTDPTQKISCNKNTDQVFVASVSKKNEIDRKLDACKEFPDIFDAPTQLFLHEKDEGTVSPKIRQADGSSDSQIDTGDIFSAPTQKLVCNQNKTSVSDVAKLNRNTNVSKLNKNTEMQKAVTTPTRKTVTQQGEKVLSPPDTVKGVQIQNDNSGDDTDPEDIFSAPTQKITHRSLLSSAFESNKSGRIQTPGKGTAQHAKSLPVPKIGENVKGQDNTSDDDTDPEDLFIAVTQKLGDTPNRNESKSNKIGSVKQCGQGTEPDLSTQTKRIRLPLDTVQGVKGQDVRTGDNTDPGDIFNAPTQIFSSKRNETRLSDVSKSDQNEPQDIHEAPTQVIVPAQDEEYLLTRQDSSSNDDDDDDTDPEQLFIALTQKTGSNSDEKQMSDASISSTPALDESTQSQDIHDAPTQVITPQQHEKSLPILKHKKELVRKDDTSDDDTDPDEIFNAPTQIISCNLNKNQVGHASKANKLENVLKPGQDAVLQNIFDAPTQVFVPQQEEDKTCVERQNGGSGNNNDQEEICQKIDCNVINDAPKSGTNPSARKPNSVAKLKNISDMPTQVIVPKRDKRSAPVPKIDQSFKRQGSSSGDDTDPDDEFNDLTQKFSCNGNKNTHKPGENSGLQNTFVVPKQQIAPQQIEKHLSLSKIDPGVRRQDGNSNNTGSKELFVAPAQKMDGVQSKNLSNDTLKANIENAKLNVVSDVSKHQSRSSISETCFENNTNLTDAFTQPGTKSRFTESIKSASEKDVHDDPIQEIDNSGTGGMESSKSTAISIIHQESSNECFDLSHLELPSTQELINASKVVNVRSSSKERIEDSIMTEEEEMETPQRESFPSPVIQSKERSHLKRKATSARSSYIEKKFGECLTGDMGRSSDIEVDIQPLHTQYKRRDNPQKLDGGGSDKCPLDSTSRAAPNLITRVNKTTKELLSLKPETISKEKQQRIMTANKQDPLPNMNVIRDEKNSCDEQQVSNTINKGKIKSSREGCETTGVTNIKKTDEKEFPRERGNTAMLDSTALELPDTESGSSRRLPRQRKLTWKVLENVVNSPNINKFPPQIGNTTKEGRKVEDIVELSANAKTPKPRIAEGSSSSQTLSDLEDDSDKSTSIIIRRKSLSDLDDDTTSFTMQNRLVLELKRVDVDLEKNSLKQRISIPEVDESVNTVSKGHSSVVTADESKISSKQSEAITKVDEDVKKTSTRQSRTCAAVDKNAKNTSKQQTKAVIETGIDKITQKISPRQGRSIAEVDLVAKRTFTRHKKAIAEVKVNQDRKNTSIRQNKTTAIVEADKDRKKTSTRQSKTIMEVESDSDTKKVSPRLGKRVIEMEIDTDVKKTSTRQSKVTSEMEIGTDVKKTSTRQSKVTSEMEIGTDVKKTSTRQSKVTSEMEIGTDVKKTSTRQSKVTSEMELGNNVNRSSTRHSKTTSAIEIDTDVKKSPTRQTKVISEMKLDIDVKKSPTRQTKVISEMKLDIDVKKSPTRQTKVISEMKLDIDVKKSPTRQTKVISEMKLDIDVKKVSTRQIKAISEMEIVKDVKKTSTRQGKTISEMKMDKDLKKTTRHSKLALEKEEEDLNMTPTSDKISARKTSPRQRKVIPIKEDKEVKKLSAIHEVTSEVNKAVQRISTTQLNDVPELKTPSMRQSKDIKRVEMSGHVRKTFTRQHEAKSEAEGSTRKKITSAGLSNTIPSVDLETDRKRTSARHFKPTTEEEGDTNVKTSTGQSKFIAKINVGSEVVKASRKQSKAIQGTEVDVVVKKPVSQSRVTSDIDNSAKKTPERLSMSHPTREMDEDLSRKQYSVKRKNLLGRRKVDSPDHDVASKGLISEIDSDDLKEGRIMLGKLGEKSNPVLDTSTNTMGKRLSSRKRTRKEDETSSDDNICTPSRHKRRKAEAKEETESDISVSKGSGTTPVREGDTREKDSTEDKVIRVSSRPLGRRGRQPAVSNEAENQHATATQIWKLPSERYIGTAKKRYVDETSEEESTTRSNKKFGKPSTPSVTSSQSFVDDTSSDDNVCTPSRHKRRKAETKEETESDISISKGSGTTPAREGDTREKDSTEDKVVRVSSRPLGRRGRQPAVSNEAENQHATAAQIWKLPSERYIGTAKKRYVEETSEEESTTRSNKKVGKPSTPSVTSSQSSDTSDTSKRLSRMTNKPLHQVLFTGFEDPKKYESVVKQLGGIVVDSPVTCTVLVTDKVRRTFKFLCIMGRGQPIVSPDWLTKCQKAGCFLDPWEFVVKDRVSEVKFNFSLRDSLRLASQTQFLSGCSVMATSNVKPPPQEMKGIVESCGGKFLSRSPGSQWPENSFIISCIEDKSTWNKFKKMGKHIVGAEILLSGVLQQKLDLQAHTLI